MYECLKWFKKGTFITAVILLFLGSLSYYNRTDIIMYVKKGDPKHTSVDLTKGRRDTTLTDGRKTTKATPPSTAAPLSTTTKAIPSSTAASLETRKSPVKIYQYSELPSKSDMGNMNYEDVSGLYHSYVNKKQAECRKLVRMGSPRDGGWDICDDVEVRPKNNCTVFSFGINFDFSFDDAMSRKYGCMVHSFDPSMRRPDHRRSKKIYFHAQGLSNRIEVHRGWAMKDLKTFREILGISNTPIDVLKVDIEEWELQTIPQMVKSGSMKDIRQFAVEIHVDLGRPKGREPSRNKYIKALYDLKDLHDDGFRIIYTHKNPYCHFRHKRQQRWACHEVSFVRV